MIHINVICSLLEISVQIVLYLSLPFFQLPFFLVSNHYTLISCEEGVSVDQFQPVEELLALIASFTLLGKTELKVALCVSNPQPPGFKFDPPLTKGRSQRVLCYYSLVTPSEFCVTADWSMRIDTKQPPPNSLQTIPLSSLTWFSKDWLRGRMEPPNDHTVHLSFALLPSCNPPKLHHPLSLSSHTPHLYPTAVHTTPQLNRKLR